MVVLGIGGLVLRGCGSWRPSSRKIDAHGVVQRVENHAVSSLDGDRPGSLRLVVLDRVDHAVRCGEIGTVDHGDQVAVPDV